MSARLSVWKQATNKEPVRTRIAQVRLVATSLVADLLLRLVGTLQGGILLDVALRGIFTEVGHIEEVTKSDLVNCGKGCCWFL